MSYSVLKGILGVLLVVIFAGSGVSAIFLPGMQPEEAGIEFAKVEQCKMCHSKTKNGFADPFFSWRGGMMAQAARDPVFLATLTIANQDVPGVGEFCYRCHTPRGWLEGRSEPGDGSALNREDMYGVSCDVCHRLMDPLSSEAKKLVKDVPPGYGNAMMVAGSGQYRQGTLRRRQGRHAPRDNEVRVPRNRESLRDAPQYLQPDAGQGCQDTAASCVWAYREDVQRVVAQRFCQAGARGVMSIVSLQAG